MALLKNLTSGLFKRSVKRPEIISDFILRNRKIVADFAEDTGIDITLLDAQVWPWGKNDKKTLLKASAHVFGKKKARFYRSFFDHNHDFRVCMMPGFKTVVFRLENDEELLDVMRVLSHFSTKKLQLNMSSYVLYHELFHLLDDAVSDLKGEDLAIEHRSEFFCDFSACLKILADSGENIFMDVARMRSLSAQALQAFYQELSSELELGQYLNHHLYATYQEWRTENTHIDISKLTIPEIVKISAECTLKRAHKTQRLCSYVENVKKKYPDDHDAEGRKNALMLRLNHINKSPVNSPQI